MSNIKDKITTFQITGNATQATPLDGKESLVVEQQGLNKVTTIGDVNTFIQSNVAVQIPSSIKESSANTGIPVTGLFVNPFSTNITSAGSTHSNATVLTSGKKAYFITSSISGGGVILPSLKPGESVEVFNVDSGSGFALLVYPPSGSAINLLTATTDGYSVISPSAIKVWCVSSTQLYVQPYTS